MTKPPVASKRPHPITTHGHTRIDNYYWLRDDQRKDPDVLAYLEAENAWTEHVLAPTAELQQTLFEELKARMPGDDVSVPVELDGYEYYRRLEKDKEQAIYARRKVGSEAEQVLLDENVLGADHDYYKVGDYAISGDDQWLAWTEDTVSRHEYTLKLRALDGSGKTQTVIERVSPNLAWGGDHLTLFYVRLQQETLIPHQVWRHRIGTCVDDDVLVYEEADPSYYLSLHPARDRKHLLITLSSTLTSEIRILDKHNIEGEFEPLIPRQSGHEYDIEIQGDDVLIRSNQDAVNFALWRAPLNKATDRSSWQEVLPHRDEVLLHDVGVYGRFIVTAEVERGNLNLRVLQPSGQQALIDSDEPAYAMAMQYTPDSRIETLRYSYASLTTPHTVFDLELASGEKTQRKRAFAGDDFQSSGYRTHRVSVSARDGTEVLATLLCQADARPDGCHPIFILGYGAYGLWYEPEFRRDVFSLVDRGFVFAIAHIRGGEEMGRHWYEQGRLLNKLNTFHDFIDVAKGLVEIGWGDASKVVGSGRSAGGLLIGAVANMAADTFAALTTGVPFVDVVTTMLDETIPLTTFEYDEWGNPNDPSFYDYMLAYSPYDQVKPQRYPHMYVATGLWDSQVQYWEPAKWVARLRDQKTGNHQLLLFTDMSAGHGGGSGRYQRLEDTAREYAFVLSVIGVAS
ncbi:MAG: oligopeptidase B [Lysobacteraceae bacterium]|nr:MAG: oligopeptidase B [Xanthomonadaceae bacterium]